MCNSCEEHYKKNTTGKRLFIIFWFGMFVALGGIISLKQLLAKKLAFYLADRSHKVYCGFVVERYSSGFCIVQLNSKYVDSGEAQGFSGSLFSLFSPKLFVGVKTCKLPKYTYVCSSEFSLCKNRFWNRFGVYLKAQLVYTSALINFKQTKFCNSRFFCLLRKAEEYKKNLFYRLSYSSDPDIIGLIWGILLGDDRFLSQDFVRLFKQLGLMHILVVSGYNIAIFSGLVDIVLQRSIKGLARFFQFIIKILIVGALIMIIGPSPPVLRAFIFWLITVIFNFIGIRINNIAKFYYTGLFMFGIWNCFWIFNVSAILSFLASLGVIYLSPLFSKYIKLPFIRSVLPETLGAMLATTPVLFLIFGYVPSFKVLLANILILPFVDIVSILGYSVFPILFIPIVGDVIFAWIVGGIFNILVLVLYLIAKFLN